MISAFTNLTVIPWDTVVLVGDSTALGCSSSEASVIWSHTTLEGKIEHFYKDNNITHKYRSLGFRMGTKQELSSERNLEIKNVTTAIAGKYECADLTHEERKSAELIVLGE